MKIVYITLYPDNKAETRESGVASYTKKLIANIPYKQEDRTYVLCQKINNKYEEYDDGNTKIIRCFNKNPSYMYNIFRKVKQIEPNVIHIQQELSLYGNILTAYLLQILIASLHKYHTVVTLHGVVSPRSINENFVRDNYSRLPAFVVKIGFYTVYKPLCMLTERIIVHEQCFKEILINEYGVRKEKIHVVYHGVEDLETIDKEGARKKLVLNPVRDVVLFMGYLTGYKGIEILIEGFAEYLKINPNAFLIIGAGKHPRLGKNINYLQEYTRLEQKAKNLIGDENYRWVGFIPEDDIITYYSAADVSIYPYTIQMSSSGPMAISIAYEMPFLASDVFGNFITNKGVLFERNKTSLGIKLDKFFQSKDEAYKYVKDLKQERLYKTVGKATYSIYLEINKEVA